LIYEIVFFTASLPKVTPKFTLVCRASIGFA
jgi:hypothetical protein